MIFGPGFMKFYIVCKYREFIFFLFPFAALRCMIHVTDGSAVMELVVPSNLNGREEFPSPRCLPKTFPNKLIVIVIDMTSSSSTHTHHTHTQTEIKRAYPHPALRNSADSRLSLVRGGHTCFLFLNFLAFVSGKTNKVEWW